MIIQLAPLVIRQTVNWPAYLVARYGGEEFAVILSNTNPEGAGHAAESIRAGVLDLKIAHSQSTVDEYLAISCGVSGMFSNLQRSIDGE